MRRASAESRQQGRQPILISLGEVSEHKAGHRILMAWMANAKPHAAIVGSQMGMDRAKAVMACMPTALFEPQFPWGEIQFIVKHGDLIQRDLVKPNRLAHRLTGEVHEGCGFEQQHLLPAQGAIADVALKF